MPEEDEWDGQDLAAAHLIAETGAGIALGTTRVLSSGQIGRMAVLPDCRCRGVGRELLRAAVTLISEEAWPAPFLNAQTSAIGFYQKAGFIAEGPEFLDAGIPHRRMVLAVSAARVE